MFYYWIETSPGNQTGKGEYRSVQEVEMDLGIGGLCFKAPYGTTLAKFTEIHEKGVGEIRVNDYMLVATGFYFLAVPIVPMHNHVLRKGAKLDMRVKLPFDHDGCVMALVCKGL